MSRKSNASTSRSKRTENKKVLSSKERFEALKNLPPFFKLVWQTSPRLLILNAVLRLLRSGIPVSMLYVGKLIIDEVIRLNSLEGEKELQFLFILIGSELGLAVLSDVFNRSVSLIDSLLGDLFSNETSVKIMQHAGKLDLVQFEDAEFYDKLERARQQTVRRTILISQVLGQVQSVITMAFLAAGLIAFNPWLILILIITVFPAFLGETYFNERSYSLNRSWTPERRELDYFRYIGASDDTAKEVKIFGLSDFLASHFKNLANRYYHENKKIAISRASWGSLFAVIGSVGYYSAYVVIIFQTISGQITIGDLTFLSGSFMRLRNLLESVLNQFSNVAENALYLSDFFAFFNLKPSINSSPDALQAPFPIKTGFTFEDVGFRYSNTDKWAVRHLNFTLHAGEKLALVGENGAGKTTLVKLLARLYDPDEGRILLDGVDIREYDPVSLRKTIGVIFQDFVRYQLTAGKNIAVGNIEEQDNENQITEAAHKGMANQVIDNLPSGFDQMIGRRFAEGVNLSGGEWQKVAISRAYMRDAQVMILDEPTAALDARAEYEVFLRFTDLTKGKSAVIISHRFSTVRMADRILVLQNGQLLEIGTHDELLQKDGKYAELFNLQAEGYR
jgi:ATP-binding cassette, subfamily B, bacterial